MAQVRARGDATGAGEPPKKPPKRKNANGEGSIYFNEGKGLYVGKLTVGRKPNGTLDRREVYGRTRAECRKKLNALKAQQDRGTLPEHDKANWTVAQFLTTWKTGVTLRVRPKTAQRYAELVDRHLSPGLGRHKLRDLKPHHLEAMYSERLSTLSAQTVVHMHRCLHVALNAAVSGGYVDRNVASVVKPPRVARREIVPPTPEVVVKVLDGAERAEDRLAALWTVASFTGARQGELLALTWSDIDFEGARMWVKRTLVGIEKGTGAPITGEPKTTKSRRAIPLGELPEVVDALRRHQHRQKLERVRLGPGYSDNGLVFCTRLGTALDATNVGKYWRDACKRAEVTPAPRFHDLRHFAITSMLLAGQPVNAVSETVGHHSPSMTLDRYGHLLPGSKATALGALGETLRRARLAAAP